MERTYLQMIEALRETARRLQKGAEYDWNHQGNCNCGHLVQTVTKLSKAEIHAKKRVEKRNCTNQPSDSA